MNICAYTAVCGEDREWVPQYLAEAERLGVPFCVHLDRCSTLTRMAFKYHPLCRGWTESFGGEFSERHKQGVFDLAARTGADWAMAWDVDETWCPDFSEQVENLDPAYDHVDTPWLNLWESKDRVRIDGPFAGGHRVKFYNLSLMWKFTHHVINGPKCQARRAPVLGKLPIACVHHGMMTHELRMQHKARWDRIYTEWVGANPYGFWNYALAYDEYPPVVVPLAERLKEYR